MKSPVNVRCATGPGQANHQDGTDDRIQSRTASRFISSCQKYCQQNRACLGLPIQRCLLLLAIFCLAKVAIAEDTETAFLRKYCVDCHGAQIQEGDRRFDQLSTDIVQTNDAEIWHEVLDRLNLGDMPPEDAKAQPSDQERLDLVAKLTKRLSEKARTNEKQKTVFRRLNRREYDAAMRHVFGLESMLADPTSDFPPDETEHHFDNIGDSLVVSDFLLTRYLAASDQYLNAARELAELTRAVEEPKTHSWSFTAPFCRNMPNPDGQDQDGKFQHLRENPTDRYGYLWLSKLRKGLPASGNYRIRVKAQAIHRDYPYKETIIGVPREDPLRLAIVAADTRTGDLATNNPTDYRLAEFDVPDNEPRWLETTVWLDKFYQPRFAFPNGPVRIKYMRHQLLRNHREHFPKFIKNHVHVFATMHPDYDKKTAGALEKAFLTEQDRLKKQGQPYDVFGTAHRMHTDAAWRQFYREYDGPRIRIYEVKIDGPLPETSPPIAATFFPQGELNEVEAEKLIRDFARRAWRYGSPTASNALLLYHQERESGASQIDALQIAYQTILCSPQFLYHRTRRGELNNVELASRLSFFLWRTPPDAELLRIARAGRLTDSQVLNEQTERLLDDPRHRRFVHSFADAWLQLSKLGTMLPDRTEHPAYYNQRLDEAMRSETLLFLEDAIRQNLPVSALVDCDYSFLNSSLARLYGIDGVTGHHFRKVNLVDRNRGGLLGQASVLTATANGIDTSPVVRGMWVMESLLGTPPPPPPPDVEPIEPDIRGSTTIREQLEAHRSVATCASCHRRIDPPGFALEVFDEIGRFRTHYDSGGWQKRQLAKVDASGTLASGESFQGIQELKEILKSKQNLIASNLASRLLTYATGRMEDGQDKATLLSLNQPNDSKGIRALIHWVVQCDAFRR